MLELEEEKEDSVMWRKKRKSLLKMQQREDKIVKKILIKSDGTIRNVKEQRRKNDASMPYKK